MKNVRQLAYVCPLDTFDQTLDYWERAFDVGPFFVGDVQPENQTFEGAATSARVRIALTYLGQVQIEVIAPLDDDPSPWTAKLGPDAVVPSAGLFHHVLIDSDDYDVTRDRLLAAGFASSYEAEFGGRRLCYLDGQEQVGNYVELIEWREWNHRLSDAMKQACDDYDGQDSRRSYVDIAREVRSAHGDSVDDRSGVRA